MSTTITLLDFIAPEFSGETTADKETAIDMATQRLSSKAWGTLYQQAVVHLAAHVLKKRDRSTGSAQAAGFVGPVTSIKSGDLSISGPGPSTGGGSDADLKSTEYGQALLTLRESIGTTPFISD